MSEEIKMESAKTDFTSIESRTRVPLKAFIFAGQKEEALEYLFGVYRDHLATEPGVGHRRYLARLMDAHWRMFSKASTLPCDPEAFKTRFSSEFPEFAEFIEFERRTESPE